MSEMECIHGVYVKLPCYDCLKSILGNTEKDLNDIAWRYSLLETQLAKAEKVIEFCLDDYRLDGELQKTAREYFKDKEK